MALGRWAVATLILLICNQAYAESCAKLFRSSGVPSGYQAPLGYRIRYDEIPKIFYALAWILGDGRQAASHEKMAILLGVTHEQLSRWAIGDVEVRAFDIQEIADFSKPLGLELVVGDPTSLNDGRVFGIDETPAILRELQIRMGRRGKPASHRRIGIFLGFEKTHIRRLMLGNGNVRLPVLRKVINLATSYGIPIAIHAHNE